MKKKNKKRGKVRIKPIGAIIILIIIIRYAGLPSTKTQAHQ